MSRLTNKNMIIMFARSSCKTLFNKIYRKLDKLEDLEEQLGCPLEVFAKILLYPKIRTRFGIREIDKIDYYVEDDNRGLMIYFKNGTFDKVSNYKKTWWLSETKEE